MEESLAMGELLILSSWRSGTAVQGAVGALAGLAGAE